MTSRFPAIDDLIADEFVAYYNADEPVWGIADRNPDALADRAADSGGRLRVFARDDEAPELASRLRAMADNPLDPLLARISNSTMIDWDEPDFWPTAQRVLRAMADATADTSRA